MKILDRFILRAYLGPFFRSFIVILFLLVLQFLSRFKDDLFGKGIKTSILLEIFGYASVSLIVLAFPASVLLSSLFTMGSMGEHYETAALRSSGMRLTRVMRPMFTATLGIAIASFLISVYVVPVANLKFYSRVYDIRQVKPTFTLVPGNFYNGIDGYTIRVGDRDLERDLLYQIMIFDHTVLEDNPEAARAARQAAGIAATRSGRQGVIKEEEFKVANNNRIIMADSGRMQIREDGLFMRMTLYHGVSHEALADVAGKEGQQTGPAVRRFSQERYARYYFDTLIYNFDLTGFAMQTTDEQAFRTHHYMLNINELSMSIDSIAQLRDSIGNMLGAEVTKAMHNEAIAPLDSTQKTPPPSQFDLDALLRGRRADAIALAKNQVILLREKSRKAKALVAQQEQSLRDYEIEFHSKYLLPLACMVFLLIGAPLGSIIRKGGVGLPILFSIVFFVAFYLLMVQGKKLAREDVMAPWAGVWLPLFVLSPIALFITYEATNEARILNARLWWLLYVRVSAVLWYLNPLRFLVTLQFFRKGLIKLLEFLLSLSPSEVRKRRAIRRRAQSMRITRGDSVEYVDRGKKKKE